MLTKCAWCDHEFEAPLIDQDTPHPCPNCGRVLKLGLSGEAKEKVADAAEAELRREDEKKRHTILSAMKKFVSWFTKALWGAKILVTIARLAGIPIPDLDDVKTYTEWIRRLAAAVYSIVRERFK